MTKHSDVAGLVVVITGGARGIGLATAERLAGAGAVVAIGDRDAELAITAAKDVSKRTGAQVVAAELDVAAPESWSAFLAAVADLGPVAVLVNNAGIMPLGSILEEPTEVARGIIDVNLHGVINGTKAVAPGMVQRGHGHIINVASAVGRVALPNGASYSASKFAVVGFTEATRAELAPHGVDVCMVLPTVVLTELAAGVPAARGVRAVSADDVAVVIEAAIRKPVAELWVPRWSKTIAKTADLMPRRLKAATARLMRADSALADADPVARAAYEERIRNQ